MDSVGRLFIHGFIMHGDVGELWLVLPPCGAGSTRSGLSFIIYLLCVITPLTHPPNELGSTTEPPLTPPRLGPATLQKVRTQRACS
jgi:hypothetical protein